ncbi:MAG: response regulator, partial [Methylococcales bacterium]|nr:response regulator [Methylococcales bacterium]
NIMVDANQLETCLLNLALNARDAMAAGGTLTIRTSPADIAHSDTLRLSVTDEGTGMPKEVLDRAFEPFFSTKAKGSGTGLGLSMVHGFVNQSGGNIEIQSSPGHGTAINIILPMGNIPDSSVSDVLETEAVHQTPVAHILLVEDEPDVRDYIARALKRLGYKTTVRNSGDEAIALLKKQPHFDLVLTDIVMPGKVSGIELARYITDHQPKTRVLYMTGYSDKLNAEIDTNNLIRKPFSTTGLASKVSETLTS